MWEVIIVLAGTLVGFLVGKLMYIEIEKRQDIAYEDIVITRLKRFKKIARLMKELRDIG